MTELSDIALFVSALGWTLIHFIWQGLLIAGLMWLVYKLVPGDRTQLRYLAGLALYILLLPISINTLVFFLNSTATVAAVPGILQGEFPMVSVVAGVQPGFDFWLAEGVEPLLPVVVLLWAIGVLLLASKALIGWCVTRVLIRTHVKPIPEALQRSVDRLMERLQVRMAVSVLVSTRVKVPTLIGWIKPVILLPASVLIRLPLEQIEMIIAHELGHIRRYDYLFNLLQLVVDTLFFYHPCIRWMSRKIRQEREHCCDDFVLHYQGRPSLYARALANLEILRQPQHALTLAATGGDLLSRVHRIASTEMPRKSGGFAQIAMMSALIGVASMGAHSGLEVSAQTAKLPSVTGKLDSEFRFSSQQAVHTTVLGQVEPYANIRKGVERSRIIENTDAGNELSGRATAVVQGPAQSEVTPLTIQSPPARSNEAGELQVKAQVSFSAPVGFSEAVQLASLSTEKAGPGLERQSIEEIADEVTDTANAQLEPVNKSRAEATVRAMKTVNPRYPSYARSRAVEGWVKLSFKVDNKGRARDISVVDASPERMFNRAAEKALGKWRFEVLPGHDTSKSLAQTFDFAMHPSDARPATRQRRCTTTGSNICGMNYRQESVDNFPGKKVSLEAANRN